MSTLLAVSPPDLLSGSACAQLGNLACTNDTIYHCTVGIKKTLSWAPWYSHNCNSTAIINLDIKVATQGGVCTVEGATDCTNGITYQCAYFNAGQLTWDQYFVGGCATTASSSSSAPLPTMAATSSTPPCYPPFQTGVAYSKGAIMSKNGVNYQAKFYTTNDPTTSTDWKSFGTCNTASLKPRPYSGKPGIIGYYTNWADYSRLQNNIAKLDLSGFSAINYAFLKPLADGTLVSFDAFSDGVRIPQLNGAVRIKYPNLRTIISIGGWSGSTHFSTIAASAGTIQTFVKGVHAYLDQNGFDGVDLDWEYPKGKGLSCNTVSPNDPVNFLNLLKALRSELGPTRIISMAVSADISRYAIGGTNYMPQYAKYVSYIMVMTYDFYGSWNPFTDFNSPLSSPGSKDPKQPTANGIQYTIAKSLSIYTKAGVKKQQLVAGLAFYGRSWQVKPNPPLNGLYQLCAGALQPGSKACVPIVGDVLDVTTYPDACGGLEHSSVWMYMNLRGDTRSGNAAFIQPNAPLANGALKGSNGWKRVFYPFAQTPTLYHPSYRGAPTFISYDDPQSIKAKSLWSKKAGLGGIMAWEIDQDFQGEMLGALKAGWGK
ncbi:hypothetical protein HDU98_001636 [Podochytrium sp. JEL0797]|nr:hypothetical protein HDU98_001636 [Podochytrium sp. JEL0797]